MARTVYPKKPENGLRREARIAYRLRPHEYEAIAAAAAIEGRLVGEFARDAAIEKTAKVLRRAD